MRRLRYFTIVFIILLLTFTVRLSDVVMRFALDNASEPQSVSTYSQRNAAFAEEATEEDEHANEESHADNDESEGEQTEEGHDGMVVDGEQMSQSDPFLPKYSDAEVEILESLAKRREELEERARQMDQRALLLQATERKLEEKMAEMETLKAELEELLAEQQNLQEDRLKRLVKIYENMKPKDAAAIFNELNFDVLLNLLDRMSERKTAPIIAEMDPAKARLVSTRLAEQRALPRIE